DAYYFSKYNLKRKNNSGRNTVADTVISFVRLLGYGLWIMGYELWVMGYGMRLAIGGPLPHYHTTILPYLY
ncbi:MAG TPA: hypothetical protein VGZ90_18385, partial [Puia sp.]|nr:hypothetical protein [Puia sp.]